MLIFSKQLTKGILFITAVFSLLLSAPTFAYTSTTIYFTGMTFNDPVYYPIIDCNDVKLNYEWTFSANEVDRTFITGGADFHAIITTDGNRVVLDNHISFNYTNDYSGLYGNYTEFGTINDISARPVTVTLYDIPDPGDDFFNYSEDTQAAIDYVRANGEMLGQASFDPAIVSDTCSSLPYTGSVSGTSPLIEATCVDIPAGSVVGALPFTTQAYYAPGQLADVTLNTGTYWVVGVDESGQYYKIVLACQYLWLPVSSMQPSPQPPQNGAPLPTRVVR